MVGTMDGHCKNCSGSSHVSQRAGHVYFPFCPTLLRFSSQRLVASSSSSRTLQQMTKRPQCHDPSGTTWNLTKKNRLLSKPLGLWPCCTKGQQASSFGRNFSQKRERCLHCCRNFLSFLFFCYKIVKLVYFQN